MENNTSFLRQKKQLTRHHVVMPFTKSVGIAFRSIKARFLRSIITTISLVLAVSFLCFTQVTSDIANSLASLENADLQRKLTAAGYDPAPDTKEETTQTNKWAIKNSPKQKWIVSLSLLVCVVGIVNAQLMAVTERFREIGTMKCLGALNHFIVRLFMLEALMEGGAGASAGAVFGALFALLTSFFQYGSTVIYTLPLQDILLSMGKAFITGCILSLAGVIYPVIVAARMEPVEAMRMEN
ncbi:conserved membrane hypothetical protein [Desulfamplus magnetovallimortis]|uniref:ABC3 transporter permease C-terminal domain-containing protein n=1 Tax=Desulfamplus magnetovallimortis TaxID=1246637 RepID=A0A1W1HCJ4_9BACT|nr:FtsX-like permease family protein [Desulfamplus magnetovallimortis]SLM30156.1 conserved membrane hypothetical protein [Desulfamplus magnetovallimortis]